MLRRTTLGVAAVVATGSLAALLTDRLWPSPPAKSARVIDEAQYVKIGGIEQFIRITGESRANPVLLFVHGGPGLSMLGFLPSFQPWEKYFTIVQWDQRGAGRTYGRNGADRSAPMTIDRMTQDGVELAQFLTRHLHGKIVVVGHSWGSILGVRMVHQRPDLFAAYVGTGQFVDRTLGERILYEDLLSRARAARDGQTIAELQHLSDASARDRQAFVAKTWASVYAPPAERRLKANMSRMRMEAPGASWSDIGASRAGRRFSIDHLAPQIAACDIRQGGLDFAVPFFVIQGDEDSQTPAILARRYFDAVHAPTKRYIPLKGGGHFAVITMSAAFLNALVAYVRPLAIREPRRA